MDMQRNNTGRNRKNPTFLCSLYGSSSVSHHVSYICGRRSCPSYGIVRGHANFLENCIIFSPKSLDGRGKICYTTGNAMTRKKYRSFRTCTESRWLVKAGEGKRGIHSVSSAPNGFFTHGMPIADPCIYPSRLRRDVPVIGQGHRLCDSRRFSLSLANGVSHVPDEAGCCKTPAK